MKAPLNDLLVVIPGIMGSELYDREGRAIWAPTGGWGRFKLLWESLANYKLPLGVGDDTPVDGVWARALIPDLHVIPGLWTANFGYSALIKFLAKTFVLDDSNYLEYAYDWRLSNRFTAKRLSAIVGPKLEALRAHGGARARAKIVFVCHSMGGLVARWYVHQEGGAELTRRVITLGTPHRGSVKALDQLANGVWLNKLTADMTEFGRTLPSVHQLLPTYRCIENADGLVSLGEVDVPGVDSTMRDDGLAFHATLDAATDEVDLVPFVGFRQPTATTARVIAGRVLPLDEIAGRDERGDGTVARLAATPSKLPPDDASIRGVSGQHAALPSLASIHDDLEFALGARTTPHMASRGLELWMRVADVVAAHQPIEVTGQSTDGRRKLTCRVSDAEGNEIKVVAMRLEDELMRVELPGLPEGNYAVTVTAPGARTSSGEPVRTIITVV